MELRLIWSIAAAANSLAAVAAAGLGWAIGRRARRGRETFLLLAALIVLALQYGVWATDAFVHTAGPSATSWTLWSGAGHVLSAFLWTLTCLFLLAVVQRISAPQPLDGSVKWSVIAATAAMSGLALFMFGRAVYDQWAGAPAETLHKHLTGLMGSWNGLAVFFISVPSIMLNVLYERLPRAERGGWPVWMASNINRNKLISLNLADYPDFELQGVAAISRSDYNSLSGIYATALVLILLSGLDSLGCRP
jgi:hypothetical protein